MKLDDDAKAWHADATLPTSLRAHLSQSGAGKKRRSLPLALGYGLAVFVGIGLGVGYVTSRHLPPVTTAQSQGRPTPITLNNKKFQQVVNTIKFWREADSQARKKKKGIYEAIFFTDLECPSCQKANVLIKQATWLRVGVCHVPMQGIHPHAVEWANFVETAKDPMDFWKLMDVAHGEGRISRTVSSSTQREAEQRVAKMLTTAQAAGVTEVPTIWVRSGASMQMQSLGGIAGIKIILETLQ